ncbi:AAA family ATPase [Burkholderia cenocepacia]|uniref:AAA family ATPase n=1 Tax=Burkholderia cenocepacia TaxID=95486 RepID=UPI000AC96513|nr:AAA family ATPase [Burkholderia cenocepacia]
MSIPIVGKRQVYAVDVVQKALSQLDEQAQPHLARQLHRMVQAGGSRYVSKPSSHNCLDELYESCPNFAGVLDDLKKYLALAVDGDEPLSFMPILLLGDPGVGKTHFGKALGAALGTDFRFVSMASTTAGFILSGASSTWKDSKPGLVAKALVEGLLANPVFLIDEVDKGQATGMHDPLGPLYSLLESETAAEFIDEYLEVPVDARGITWVFTANDQRGIPEPILSRMAVYEVPAPTFEQARNVAQSIYQYLLREHRWKFEPALSSDCVDAAATFPPREMRKRILDAMGNAKVWKRDRVLVDDFGTTTAAYKRTIGFTLR